MLFNFLVAVHYRRIPILDGRIILVLNIHILAHIAVGGGLSEAVDDVFHIVVTGIGVLVEAENMRVVGIGLGLIENAEDPLQPVVYLSMEQGNLDYDAVVYKALDERVGYALRNHIAVVVVGVVVDINNGLLNVANPVSEKIDGYHRYGIALVAVPVDIALVAVLRA